MASYCDSTFETHSSLGYSQFLTKILKILGIRDNPSPSRLMASVQKGFPFSVFEVVQNEIDLPQKQLADILGIPSRTISRRKEGKQLTPVESDRLYRIVRVLSSAVEVLGDVERARAWLKSPNTGLGGETPIHLLDTDIGADLVDDVLKRIKYGIYG